MDAKTPNEVIGVLAHETGHIAGGHLSRLREQLAQRADRSRSSPCCSASARWSRRRAAAAGSMGQAGAAAIAGAAGGDPELAALPISARRRTQADRAGVQVPHRHRPVGRRACTTTFKRLRRSDRSIRPRYVDPYMQSHPLPAERVARARANWRRSSPYWDKKDPPDAAAAARPDARQALRLHRAAATRCARRYPADRHQPAGALCARHCGLSLRRPAHGASAQIDAPDPGAAAATRTSTSSRARRCSKAASRAEAIAPLRQAVAARAQSGADPDHAGAGADRDQRSRQAPTRR